MTNLVPFLDSKFNQQGLYYVPYSGGLLISIGIFQEHYFFILYEDYASHMYNCRRITLLQILLISRQSCIIVKKYFWIMFETLP